MAAADARPVPQKNVAFRAYFPILDADGDPVIGAAGLDSEVSVDGGTAADCTNEATEILAPGGSAGWGEYYLDLTAAEMNGDAVVVQVKTSTAGAKATTLVFYPEELGDYRINLPAIPNNWLTAAGINAGALNGKGDWLTALPAIPNNWITAAGITAAALNGKGDWPLNTDYTAGRAVKLDNLDATITSRSTLAAGAAMTLTAGERTSIANEVEAQIIDETDSEKVLTAITDKIAAVNPSLSGLTLNAIAAAVRDVLNTGPAANSLGAMVKAVADRTPGAGTLATTADVPTAAAVAAQVTADHGAGLYTRNTEPDNATVTWLRNVMEGDEVIDNGTVPWHRKVTIRQTATVLVDKRLRQPDGSNVSSETHRIGSAKDL